MNQIDPRKVFTDRLADKPEWNFRSLAASDMVHTSIAIALALLASGNASAEQLSGANNFVRIWLNLAEPVNPPKEFPDKKLDHSVLNPSPPQAERKP